MGTEIEIKKDGIFIPIKTLEGIGLEDFEVEISETELKIRPKSYTKKMLGFFKTNDKLVNKAIRDYERETERRHFGEEE